MSGTTIDLRGKVALVTGSARRVGKQIALALAAQGMHQVIHHSSSDQDAEATVAEVQALDVEGINVKADFSDPAAIDALFQAIRERFGHLDVLVNSASIFERGAIPDLPLVAWQQSLNLNLTAPFLCSQHAAHLMPNGGAIVNIADASAFQPWKNYPQHSVSKAALVMLTEVLAISLAPRIRVNAIAPGPVLRDAGNSPEAWAKIGERLPLQHTGDPADVAQAVIFLVSQPFLTGITLRIDGGEHLR